MLPANEITQFVWSRGIGKIDDHGTCRSVLRVGGIVRTLSKFILCFEKQMSFP